MSILFCVGIPSVSSSFRRVSIVLLCAVSGIAFGLSDLISKFVIFKSSPGEIFSKSLSISLPCPEALILPTVLETM